MCVLGLGRAAPAGFYRSTKTRPRHGFKKCSLEADFASIGVEAASSIEPKTASIEPKTASIEPKTGSIEPKTGVFYRSRQEVL